jgi:hypothetical protein
VLAPDPSALVFHQKKASGDLAVKMHSLLTADNCASVSGARFQLLSGSKR